MSCLQTASARSVTDCESQFRSTRAEAQVECGVRRVSDERGAAVAHIHACLPPAAYKR